ncbi:MAG: HD domain-containing protein [Candidatus Hydrogenedentes bacterium]|nr:HD domain-containing protein [Candidatus Hydrogenedentota bacterium]
MRLVRISNLAPGLIVGRPVLDDKGQVLLNQDVVLTPAYIRALEAKGCAAIYIKEPDVETDVLPDDDLDPKTRRKAIIGLNKTFQAIESQVDRLREQSFENLKKLCETPGLQALMSPSGPFAEVQKAVEAILNEILTQSTLAGLTSIRTADSALHNHCIDVCVVAIMVGRVIGLPNPRLKQLAIGSILHDIGKVFLKKSGDDVNHVRKHTLLGFELLKNAPDADILAPYVALEHHERQDGSGQPRGLVGTNTIHRNRSAHREKVPTLLGEIAALANYYDHLLTGSASRPPMPPDSALHAIQNAAGTHLNAEVVKAFLRVVPVYPLGTEVLVRSAEYRNHTGLVTKVNRTQLDRPVITLIRNPRGKPISPIEINMMHNETIQVRSKIS